MPRVDGTDPTASARQARRRARRQLQAERDEATQARILAAVLELSTRVDNLDRKVDNLARGRDVTTRPRDVTPGGRGRVARGETGGLPPTGVVGPHRVTPSHPDEDVAAAILAALQGAGSNSAGAIRDALGHGGLELPLGRVTAALVQLQAERHVIREAGRDAHHPDTWVAVPGALTLLELEAPRLEVRPAPDLHVTCQDYQAHHADHAWDAALGAFVCARCHASTAPAPDRRTVTHA